MCVILIQCYVKPIITLNILNKLKTFNNLKKYILILYIDKAKPNSKFTKNNNLLIKNLLKFKKKYNNLFKNIIIKINNKNLGPYLTCFHANNFAFNYSDFVIFSEDDSIFCNDSLSYFDFFRKSNLINNTDIIGVTTCSPFFYHKNISTCNKSINNNDLIDNIIKDNDHISVMKFKRTPNKQWGMFKMGWDKIKHIRENGGTDFDTYKYIDKNNLYFIYSVIPRTNDIGFYHNLGCTTLYYKKKMLTVPTIKFLTSDLFNIKTDNYILKDINWNEYSNKYII